MLGGSDDVELGDSEFLEKEIRHGFIKKVYAILTVQIAITVAIVCMIFFIDDVRNYVIQEDWVFWTAFAVSFVVIIVLACATELRRRSPINIICLLIFTICEGVLVGSTCTFYDGREVAMALGICAVVTLFLTLFAFQTRIDFTMCSGFIYVLLITLVMFGIFAAIWRNDVLYTFYASLGAFVFSMYIVFDTQLLLGGQHKYAVSPEEYIFAALNLYIDIINLFLFLLMLFKR